ncbi:hypothetical protein BC835DRAFT_1410000 [Cytidiella melzeri]|nr:hypothetical protein BC835DRAFT_1410000 [Cytidiella melzeri]
MYAKSSIAFLAIALLAPAMAAPAQLETVLLPGFGQEVATVSQAGVGSDGQTTFIISPTGTAAVASISGPVTVVAGGTNSESKFQLADGSNVDNKCSVNGNSAACTVVVENFATTITTSFSTALPTGFVGFGQAQTQASSAPSPSPTGKKSGAMKAGATATGALISIGLMFGMLL